MSRRLLVIFALLALAFAVLTGLAVRRGVLASRPQSAAIGGPFQLVDQSGRRVDQSVLEGKWSAVFFGYTYCPEACPTTLFALSQAEKQLGPKARDFQTVFISVDPARDTPEKLKAFLASGAAPKATVGLTGSADAVAKAAQAYHVYYQKAGDGPSYEVNHSTITYLMNPRGEFACAIPYDETPDKIVAKVEAAMAQGKAADSC
jgi:protein SCO1/2